MCPCPHENKIKFRAHIALNSQENTVYWFCLINKKFKISSVNFCVLFALFSSAFFFVTFAIPKKIFFYVRIWGYSEFPCKGNTLFSWASVYGLHSKLLPFNTVWRDDEVPRKRFVDIFWIWIFYLWVYCSAFGGDWR